MQVVPEPEITSGRQFFSSSGTEIFYAEAQGRRPDVRDALRVMGAGATRHKARYNAQRNWKKAYRALQSKVLVAKAD